MNNVDRQYLDLVQDILDNGTRKQTRAGEVLSVFDRTMRFNLKEGLPLLTTKKVFTKGCIHELLWFLKGDTNIKYLVDNGVNIWTDDAYRYYKELCAKHRPYPGATEGEKPLEKDDFVKNVIAGNIEQFYLYDEENEEFYVVNYTYGNLGDVYGKQWRRFGTSNFDQIQHIVDTLRTNPDDRRMLCVAFNPDVLYSIESCALPPCHVLFQFYTRELEDGKRELSLMFMMRSNDVPLGLPINIESYSLLLYMMCKITGMVPGELVYHGIDVHIYTNQIDGCREQLTRKGSDDLPILKFTEGKEFKELSDFTYEDFIIENYNPDPVIKFPLSVG